MSDSRTNRTGQGANQMPPYPDHCPECGMAAVPSTTGASSGEFTCEDPDIACREIAELRAENESLAKYAMDRQTQPVYDEGYDNGVAAAAHRIDELRAEVERLTLLHAAEVAQTHALRIEVERMRPIAEAAAAWRAVSHLSPHATQSQRAALIQAVDAEASDAR